MITARELRNHFGPRDTAPSRRRHIDYFAIAAHLAREQAARQTTPETGDPQIDSLTISRDLMPHHYIARAVILDLQPSELVAAVGSTMDEITKQYPHAVRTGWRAECDGLRIYFYAWSADGAFAAQTARVA
jgi:hypothetical protein